LISFNKLRYTILSHDYLSPVKTDIKPYKPHKQETETRTPCYIIVTLVLQSSVFQQIQ